MAQPDTMTEARAVRPTPTILRPLWTPLGVRHFHWGTRFYISIGDPPRIMGLRAGQLYGVTFLAEIYPDLEYWRQQFPYGRGRKIDTRAALAYFLRACTAKGEYVPNVC